MKFAMITTFFGAHSFGGDAAYVERLSQALCRRGQATSKFPDRIDTANWRR